MWWRGTYEWFLFFFCLFLFATFVDEIYFLTVARTSDANDSKFSDNYAQMSAIDWCGKKKM
jgi:hypothetical protein